MTEEHDRAAEPTPDATPDGAVAAAEDAGSSTPRDWRSEAVRWEEEAKAHQRTASRHANELRLYRGALAQKESELEALRLAMEQRRAAILGNPNLDDDTRQQAAAEYAQDLQYRVQVAAAQNQQVNNVLAFQAQLESWKAQFHVVRGSETERQVDELAAQISVANYPQVAQEVSNLLHAAKYRAEIEAQVRTEQQQRDRQQAKTDEAGRRQAAHAGGQLGADRFAAAPVPNQSPLAKLYGPDGRLRPDAIERARRGELRGLNLSG